MTVAILATLIIIGLYSISTHPIFYEKSTEDSYNTKPIWILDEENDEDNTSVLNEIFIPALPSKRIKYEKSQQKCFEYGRIAKKSHRLQLRNVIGGQRALSQDFPYMAALGYDESPKQIIWYCGGTLISDQYVLTAAHCLTSREYGDVKYVRLGALDLNNVNDPSAQTFQISNRIPHPKYNQHLKYHDVALIQLNKNVVFNRFIQPACLYTKPEVNAKQLTALGYGPEKYEPKETNKFLIKVDLDLYSDRSCMETYRPQRTLNLGILTESQMCAGGISEVKDTCEGASGGPLLLVEEQRHFVVGVTSFGKPCGNLSTPGVYTKVAHYVPWIERIVWP